MMMMMKKKTAMTEMEMEMEMEMEICLQRRNLCVSTCLAVGLQRDLIQAFVAMAM